MPRPEVGISVSELGPKSKLLCRSRFLRRFLKNGPVGWNGLRTPDLAEEQDGLGGFLGGLSKHLAHVLNLDHAAQPGLHLEEGWKRNINKL